MRKAWWKIITIVLLIYVVAAGFLIPLKPSVTSVLPSTGFFNADDPVSNSFKIYVYNGNLKSEKNVDAWIYSKTDQRSPVKLSVVDDQIIQCDFMFSNDDNEKSFSLVVQTSTYRDTLPYAIRMITASTALQAETNNFNGKLLSIEHSPFGFPNRAILNETIRNLLFHVPIWFAMILVAAMGMFHGMMFLRTGYLIHDLKAEKYLIISVLMGILGLLTGSLWARFTWGDWWVFDVKLNGAAITVLIYIAYLVLRNGINDEVQRARISAVYSIFAFVLMLLFVMIVPRIYDSLHPGNGGNPGANIYDLDGTVRMVFYPAVIAWMGLSIWISELLIRTEVLKNKWNETI